MMSDSEGANEPAAAAAETNGGEQQVSGGLIHNHTSDPERLIPNRLLTGNLSFSLLYIVAQNVVSRVSNLPLVSSACEAVSRSYSSTKESLPLLKGVMDAAESGVRTLGAAASTGSKPLLDIIEPQRGSFCLHNL